jgi:selenoprotein W-related protein
MAEWWSIGPRHPPDQCANTIVTLSRCHLIPQQEHQPMTVTPERFAQGMTYVEYKAQMTRNRERLEENEALATLDPADIAYFRDMPQPINALVLVEDWCGDVINNLPVIALLATASGKINLRIFLRDQNLDLMDLYLKEGKYRSIPVVALFDSAFQPIGHWIERPQSVSALMDAMRQELFASDELLRAYAPDTPFGDLSEAARGRLMAAFGNFRAEQRTFADREVVREIRNLVAGAASTAPSANRLAELRERARAAAANRAAKPVKVTITYCAVCGYEPQTLALADALMRTFIYDLSVIELIPWQDGTFDVSIDGELVHSMARDGGFPDPAQIISAVRERLTPASVAQQ